MLTRQPRLKFAANGYFLSAIAVMLAGCAQVPLAVPTAPSNLQSVTPVGEAKVKIVTIGACCSMSVPSMAVPENYGIAIDSLAVVHFRLGNREVIADLTSPIGLSLTLGPPLIQRDLQQADIEGYISQLSYQFRDGARTNRLSISVLCPQPRCELADHVFDSVIVNGSKISGTEL